MPIVQEQLSYAKCQAIWDWPAYKHGPFGVRVYHETYMMKLEDEFVFVMFPYVEMLIDERKLFSIFPGDVARIWVSSIGKNHKSMWMHRVYKFLGLQACYCSGWGMIHVRGYGQLARAARTYTVGKWDPVQCRTVQDKDAKPEAHGLEVHIKPSQCSIVAGESTDQPTQVFVKVDKDGKFKGLEAYGYVEAYQVTGRGLTSPSQLRGALQVTKRDHMTQPNWLQAVEAQADKNELLSDLLSELARSLRPRMAHVGVVPDAAGSSIYASARLTRLVRAFLNHADPEIAAMVQKEVDERKLRMEEQRQLRKADQVRADKKELLCMRHRKLRVGLPAQAEA